jgi:hypothetical protein
VKKCYTLVNFCIAQELASQHPELVRKIKAACKQFPRNARSCTPRKATIKQIVAFFDLPTTEDMPVLDDAPVSDASVSSHTWILLILNFAAVKWDLHWSPTRTSLGTHISRNLLFTPFNSKILLLAPVSYSLNIQRWNTPFDRFTLNWIYWWTPVPRVPIWEQMVNWLHTSSPPHLVSRCVQPLYKWCCQIMMFI